jgi:hypothetical protein
MDIRGTDCEDVNWVITGQIGYVLLMKLWKQQGIIIEGCGILKDSPQNSGTTHHNTNPTGKAHYFILFFSDMAAKSGTLVTSGGTHTGTYQTVQETVNWSPGNYLSSVNLMLS